MVTSDPNGQDSMSPEPSETKGVNPSKLETGGDPTPTSQIVTHALERWNHPRINVWRYLCAMLGMIIMGLNDAAFGVRHKLSRYLFESY